MTDHIIFFGDIVEENGKTIRQNNLEIQHNIPVGSLVEVKYDTWFGDGACEIVHARLWVVKHTRDCDGTPLYLLARKPTVFPHEIGSLSFERILNGEIGGFCEKSLTVIPVTDELKRGENALSWGDAHED